MSREKGEMIKQRRFSKQMESTLMNHKNKKLSELTEDDINDFITVFFELLSSLLKNGTRVVFEGWISFFTKPIKRNCFNNQTNVRWNTFDFRVRTNILPLFRKSAETKISEEEYLELKKIEELEHK